MYGKAAEDELGVLGVAETWGEGAGGDQGSTLSGQAPGCPRDS